MSIRNNLPVKHDNQPDRSIVDMAPMPGDANYQSMGEMATRLLELPQNERLKEATLLSRYEHEFKPIIALADYGSTKLDVDSDNPAPFVIEKDGIEYVVRTIDPSCSFEEVATHVDAAVRVDDIPGLEHIVAASFDDGITVAPRVPGREVRATIENGEIANVTVKQLETIYGSMCEANRRGVGIDGYGHNFLYDIESGFTVVDMGLKDDNIYTSAADALYIHLAQLMSLWVETTQEMTDVDTFADKVVHVVGDDPVSVHAKTFFLSTRHRLQSLIAREQSKRA